MGNFEYFKSIINTWNSKEKHTPSMAKDMKKVLNQFSESKDSLSELEYNCLNQDFRKIYKEVYK